MRGQERFYRGKWGICKVEKWIIWGDFGGNYEGEKMEKMAENSLLYTIGIFEDFFEGNNSEDYSWVRGHQKDFKNE